MKKQQAIFGYDGFFKSLRLYYGSYRSPEIEAIVQNYLANNYKENELNKLLNDIIENYSNVYKTPPDISEIKKACRRSKKFEIQAETVWQKMISKSMLDDVLITDKIAYFVVSGYGTWHVFCKERDDKREWTHKDFVRRYIEAAEADIDVQPKKLLGYYSVEYGANFEGVKTKIIGDVKTGKKILLEARERKLAMKKLALDSKIVNFNKMAEA